MLRKLWGRRKSILYNKYYATDEKRQKHAREYPDWPLPPHEDPLHIVAHVPYNVPFCALISILGAAEQPIIHPSYWTVCWGVSKWATVRYSAATIHRIRACFFYAAAATRWARWPQFST